MAQADYSVLTFGAVGLPGVAAPRWYLGTTAPTAGTYNQGDMCFNCSPTNGGVAFWICSIAGTPGTWRTVSNS